MKLYELTQEERNLREMFEGAINHETGEIVECGTLEELNEEFKKALTVKSEGIIKVIRDQETTLEAIDKELERLTELKNRVKKSSDAFKDYVKYNMQQMGVKKIETALGNISTRQTTATEILDISVIPQEFMKEKISYSISKTDIKKALQEGKEVPGARLVVNTSLIVK